MMAERKRSSAEDIVRKLRRADELTATGKTQEQIAADLEVSTATLYNWRRQYSGVDTESRKRARTAPETEQQAQTPTRRSRVGKGRTT